MTSQEVVSRSSDLILSHALPKNASKDMEEKESWEGTVLLLFFRYSVVIIEL